MRFVISGKLSVNQLLFSMQFVSSVHIIIFSQRAYLRKKNMDKIYSFIWTDNNTDELSSLNITLILPLLLKKASIKRKDKKGKKCSRDLDDYNQCKISYIASRFCVLKIDKIMLFLLFDKNTLSFSIVLYRRL